MSSINFDELKAYIDIPQNAERLLSKSERELTFSLNLMIDGDKLIEASTYVIYANTARGPAKGGIRMSAHVTLEETRDLAERMVWKTALSGIPFGGGKSGICLDPKQLTPFEKTAVIKEYVHMINLELKAGFYVPAPDMGTTPHDMAVIYGETHILEAVTGKPPRVGGLPGRREATGRGVAHAAVLALDQLRGTKASGVRAAVQGFGNVGSWTGYFLEKAGAKIVALSDEYGGVYSEKGLDMDALMAHRLAGKGLQEVEGDRISNAELLMMDVDVLVPAACENQITEANAPEIKAPLIVEGANGPTTPAADRILAERDIVAVPDFLANSGGVVASYVEWRKAKSGSITDVKETYQTVTDRIEAAFAQVRGVAEAKKVSLRRAAEILAVSEVISSMRDRGWV